MAEGGDIPPSMLSPLAMEAVDPRRLVVGELDEEVGEIQVLDELEPVVIEPLVPGPPVQQISEAYVPLIRCDEPTAPESQAIAAQDVVDLTESEEVPSGDHRSQILGSHWEKLDKDMASVTKVSEQAWLNIQEGHITKSNEIFARNLISAGNAMVVSGKQMMRVGHDMLDTISRKMAAIKVEPADEPPLPTATTSRSTAQASAGSPTTSPPKKKLSLGGTKPVKRVGGFWVCHLCGNGYRDKRSMDGCYRIHNNEVLNCTCGKTFTNEIQIRQHIDFHENGPFICDICSKEFELRQNRDAHYKRHTQQARFHCDYPGCTKSYCTKYGLDGHRPKHDPNAVFVCKYCGSEHKTDGARRTHYSKAHPKEKKKAI